MDTDFEKTIDIILEMNKDKEDTFKERSDLSCLIV